MTPKLWGRASSVNVQKVMWALAECDVAHERIDAGWTYGQTDTPEFLAMAPFGMVPVWQEGDFAIWESHAILRHLARGPCAALWPEDLADQARADMWIEFTGTTLLPPMTGLFYQTVRNPPEARSDEAIAKHLATLNKVLDVLESRLDGRDWLVGDMLTMADIAVGTPLFRYHKMDITRHDRPVLSAYYDRLTSREAYHGSAMTSYEELRAV
jgi:glutathione S-transferase